MNIEQFTAKLYVEMNTLDPDVEEIINESDSNVCVMVDGNAFEVRDLEIDTDGTLIIRIWE